jgi:AcrR family transcriptional regulator
MTEVTAPRSDRSRNPRGQGDRLRDELIEAAAHLLATAAHPDDVSIRAVARAAGVSPTATYRHFSDRDELVHAAVGSCFGEFAQEMLEATADEPNPFERLRAAGRSYLEYAMAEHGHYRVLFSNPVPMHSDLVEADSAGKAAFEQLVDIVQACLDAGAPARSDDATYLSFQVWTWMHGIVDLRITHGHMDWPPAERLVDDVAVVLGLVEPER